MDADDGSGHRQGREKGANAESYPVRFDALDSHRYDGWQRFHLLYGEGLFVRGFNDEVSAIGRLSRRRDSHGHFRRISIDILDDSDADGDHKCGITGMIGC